MMFPFVDILRHLQHYTDTLVQDLLNVVYAWLHANLRDLQHNIGVKEGAASVGVALS